MIQGKKYYNKDLKYVTFTKHYCPYCKSKLSTCKVKKVINYNSPEAKDYDFWVGPSGHKILITGDLEFIWKEFECKKCNKHFTVEELQKIEGVYTESTSETEDADKKWKLKCGIVFVIVGITVYLTYWFIKFVI